MSLDEINEIIAENLKEPISRCINKKYELQTSDICPIKEGYIDTGLFWARYFKMTQLDFYERINVSPLNLFLIAKD